MILIKNNQNHNKVWNQKIKLIKINKIWYHIILYPIAKEYNQINKLMIIFIKWDL